MLVLLIVVPCVLIGVTTVFMLDRQDLLPHVEADRSVTVAAPFPAVRRFYPEVEPSWGPRLFADGLRSSVTLMTVASVLVPVMVLDVLAAAVMSVSLSGPLPPPRATTGSQITEVFDANGNKIAAYQQFSTNLPVASGDIPKVLKQAVVASEDRRFYDHRGIDSKSVLRALWADLTSHHYAQGASTIDQQYVRLVYGSNTRSLNRKVHEAILAGRVDSELSKDDILYGYLSRVYLGGGAYGVGAAADTYFRKSVRDLTLSEAALLASILPAPSHFDPRVDPSGADLRRRDVLTKMADQGMITADQLATASAQRVVTSDSAAGPDDHVTVVYPPRSQQSRYPWFADYVRRYLVARFGEGVLSAGVRIETSLDPALQAQAEASVGATLKGTQPPLDMAMVVLDPKTGEVKAMVGGRDFTQSQVNLALGSCPPVTGPPPDNGPICIAGGGSGRQPGSSFKPFTLAKAFEEGIDANKVYDGPSTYTFPAPKCRGNGCTIHNVESGSFGPITLRQATAFSVNTVFAQLIQDVGVAKTAEMAHRLGVTSINPNGKDPSGQSYGPGLTLGTPDVSPLDMAAAYGVFAARGMQFPATPVTRVVAADGSVLEDNRSRAGTRVIATSVADGVTDVLKDVIGYGTGVAANIGRPNGTAGKTGTSESYSDAWFVGYTPQLVTSVWMGYTKGRQPLVNIKGLPQVFGGTLPAQTWHDFMTAALAGTPAEDFAVPVPIVPPTTAYTAPVYVPPPPTTSTSFPIPTTDTTTPYVPVPYVPPTYVPPTYVPPTTRPTTTTRVPHP
ncbi:MAG: transglycosylase domain-containing protein [Actinomycetota bacterium]|nr:transglycosylase domain-containing protein [Actinomycetota bacterium]